MRNHQKTNMNLELHYSTGGHGGPYPDLETAIDRAKALLLGNRRETRIDVREGVNGKLLAVVRPDPNEDPVVAHMASQQIAFRVNRYDCDWIPVRYHRNHSWVCRETAHNTTCEFYDYEITGKQSVE